MAIVPGCKPAVGLPFLVRIQGDPPNLKGDNMNRIIKLIRDYKKVDVKPITDEDIKLSLMINRHLLIKKYDRKHNVSKADIV